MMTDSFKKFIPEMQRGPSNLVWQVNISPYDGSSLLAVRTFGAGEASSLYYTPSELDELIARLVAIKEVMKKSEELLARPPPQDAPLQASPKCDWKK